jgi:hypothetical protein
VTTINVRFPRIEELEEFNNFLILLSDLNAIYEVTATISLDHYQETWFPSTPAGAPRDQEVIVQRS